MEINKVDAIYKILPTLIHTSQPNNIIEDFLEKCTKIMGATAATLVFWESEMGYFSFIYNIPENISLNGFIILPEKGGLDGRIYRENKEITDYDSESIKIIDLTKYSKNMDALPKLKQTGYEFAFGAPVFLKEQLKATFCMYYQNRPDHITEKEKEFIYIIIRQLSLCIDYYLKSSSLAETSEERDHLQSVFDLMMNSSPDLIFNTDLVGKIKYINQTAIEILGFQKNEIIGEKVPISDKSGDKKRFFEVLRKVRNGDRIQDFFNFKINQNNGKSPYKGREECLIETTLIPIMNKNNEIDSILINGKDVTEKEQLQQEIQRYTQKLHRRKEELISTKKEIKKIEDEKKEAEKLATVGYLADKLSHQVNNPLMSVLNYITFIKQDIEELIDVGEEDKEKQQEIINNLLEFSSIVIQESDRIKKVIKELRDFSTITQDDSHYRATNLLDVLDKTISRLKNRFIENKIQIEKKIKVSKKSNFTILANFKELQTIFYSILENALFSIKYKKEGERKPDEKIRINVDQHKIDGNKYLQIKISDTGMGIKSHQMNQIYQPFFTSWPVESDNAQKHVGMSLAKVHSIIESWSPSGYISIKSNPEIGTTFILDFAIYEKE